MIIFFNIKRIKKKKHNADLLKFAKTNKIEGVMAVLDKKKGDLKADVNTKGENDWTALHYACFNGNSQMVNFILFNEA